MKILFISILALLFFAEFHTKENQQKEQFPFYRNKFSLIPAINRETADDSTMLVADAAQNPLFYCRNIFTEVCNTGECKPAELTLYWDITGNFLGFLVSDDKPLTKIGHREFNKNDYYQLFTVLNNPSSKLRETGEEKLVRLNAQKTDATSGATISVKNETLVAGGAFTCFTLWNIVYHKNNRLVMNIHETIHTGFKNDKNVNDWKTYFSDIQNTHPAELTIALNTADQQKVLRKFSIQTLLTEKLQNLSPIQILLINNYLNRQKYVYPEAKEELKNCKKLQEIFKNMAGLSVSPE
ncbi:hypothetical protein GM418_00230 [Maribellus comscasis]|uniref:Uncharacterized protein n=1 Tax=Maribellus comscasis TaxID=2681766 RepID=A0A6I6JWJ8_9BACT|nr:hypothetical protein [Maribellus comscasis]QGY42134.1 hypothetical protein GM418_00230 [Maribellus comscasis]